MNKEHLGKLSLWVCLGVALLIGCVWSYQRLIHHRSVAAAAADDVATCQRLAGQIQSWRGEPVTVGSVGPATPTKAFSRQIEQSAHNAGIASRSLAWAGSQLTTPEDAPLLNKESAPLVLHGVSLKQVIVFLHSLEAQTPGPRATEIRLQAAPQPQNPKQPWNAQVMLTYSIHTPDEARKATP